MTEFICFCLGVSSIVKNGKIESDSIILSNFQKVESVTTPKFVCTTVSIMRRIPLFRVKEEYLNDLGFGSAV